MPDPLSTPVSASAALRCSGEIVELKRGFGFIRVDGGKQEYFFHAEDLQGLHFDHLEIGDRVTFIPDDGEAKGPHGKAVREDRR